MIQSNKITGKVSTIYRCEVVPGKSKKKGRDKRFWAMPELYSGFEELLERGHKFKVTGKVDGSCCMVKDGKLLKRRDLKDDREEPEGWTETSPVDKRGHRIGFMEADHECEDKWHLDTMNEDKTEIRVMAFNDGKVSIETRPIEELNGMTVELVGPKVQGNPHKLKEHCVIPHGLFSLTGYPEDFDLSRFREWFRYDPVTKYFEGIVIHFDNGSSFKIHRHHLNMKWIPRNLMNMGAES